MIAALRGNVWWDDLHGCCVGKVHQLEEPVRSNIPRAVDKVAVAFGKVMVGEMADQALGITWESVRERDLLLKGHLKDFIGVIVHEGRSTHNELVHKDSESVPVGSSAMTHIENNLGRDVLWSTTQGVGTVPSLQSLNEAEVSQLDEAVVLDKHIFRLQVAIDQVLPVHVLKNQYDLRSIEAHKVGAHSAYSL